MVKKPDGNRIGKIFETMLDLGKQDFKPIESASQSITQQSVNSSLPWVPMLTHP